MTNVEKGRVGKLEEKIAEPKAHLPRDLAAPSMLMELKECRGELTHLLAHEGTSETVSSACGDVLSVLEGQLKPGAFGSEGLEGEEVRGFAKNLFFQ